MTNSETMEMTYDEYLDAMLRMMEEPSIPKKDKPITSANSLEDAKDFDDDYDLA